MKPMRAFWALAVTLAACQSNFVARQRASSSGSGLATGNGVGNGPSVSPDCTFPDTARSTGPTVISDFSDGVSSDGRGPYIQATDGVTAAGVDNAAALTIYYKDNESIKNPRTFTVNLNNPVRDGGGVALGIITERNGSGNGLHTQWSKVGDALQNLHSIKVGQTVTAAQMNAVFFINGRRYLLQMGPQPYGHCHNGGRTLVNGVGTSSGTIYRPTQSKWVTDLPAGSVGRLFDVGNNDTENAADKGLYYIRLHYEIGN